MISPGLSEILPYLDVKARTIVQTFIEDPSMGMEIFKSYSLLDADESVYCIKVKHFPTAKEYGLSVVVKNSIKEPVPEVSLKIVELIQKLVISVAAEKSKIKTINATGMLSGYTSTDEDENEPLDSIANTIGGLDFGHIQPPITADLTKYFKTGVPITYNYLMEEIMKELESRGEFKINIEKLVDVLINLKVVEPKEDD